MYRDLTDKAINDASEYWEAPEAIPLLCCLVPNLLVKCAEMSMDMQNTFNRWKASSKDYPARAAYLEAKADFQRKKRYKDNYDFSKLNLASNDLTKFVAMLPHGERSTPTCSACVERGRVAPSILMGKTFCHYSADWSPLG